MTPLALSPDEIAPAAPVGMELQADFRTSSAASGGAAVAVLDRLAAAHTFPALPAFTEAALQALRGYRLPSLPAHLTATPGPGITDRIREFLDEAGR